MLGRAAPGADLSAAQRRESARVGAREQLGPGMLVEALGLSGPPAAVERDTPDEDPPAGWDVGCSETGSDSDNEKIREYK